jgi:hypothetical protein
MVPIIIKITAIGKSNFIPYKGYQISKYFSLTIKVVILK